MMRCPQCGENNADGVWTCSRCGRLFADPPPPPYLFNKWSRRENLTGKTVILAPLWLVVMIGLGALAGDSAGLVFALIGFLGMIALWLCVPFAFLLDLFRSREGRRAGRIAGIRTLLIWLGLTIAGALVLVPLIKTFIDAPTRAVTTRVRGDLRTVTLALDTFSQTHKTYPAWSLDRTRNANAGLPDPNNELAEIPTFATLSETRLTLTTPVAYLSSYFSDPFTNVKGAPFAYWTDATTATHATGYIVWSSGPDYVYDLTIDNIAQAYDSRSPHLPSAYLLERTYDPSNGASSEGDIWRIKQ